MTVANNRQSTAHLWHEMVTMRSAKPKKKHPVWLQISNGNAAPTLAVGFIKTCRYDLTKKKLTSYWVCPGIPSPKVTHWCDCVNHEMVYEGP